MSSTHEVSSQKKTKRYIRKESRFIERNHLERGGHLDEFETTENTARRPGSVTLKKWMYMYIPMKLGEIIWNKKKITWCSERSRSKKHDKIEQE
uniref:Uncharacterized protein n=1 Tax=Ascaris lumbricoides TaxID=6252 RepID=A0A0M3HZK2_ASCLU